MRGKRGHRRGFLPGEAGQGAKVISELPRTLWPYHLFASVPIF